jgi:hypothetical protein
MIVPEKKKATAKVDPAKATPDQSPVRDSRSPGAPAASVESPAKETIVPEKK